MIEPSASLETERLAALHRYHILDTPAEEVYDHLTSLAARIFGVPIVLLGLVDEDRVWVKSNYGFKNYEVSRFNSFSHYTIQSAGPLLAPDTLLDSRFCNLSVVTGEPYIRFYAGAPLCTPDGFRLGTLSLLDLQPRAFNQEQLANLVDMASMVMLQMEFQLSRRKLAQSEELYRSLVRNFPNGAVFLYDQDLRFLVAEGEGLGVSGYTKETVEGKTLWDVLAPEKAELLAPPYQAALAGQTSSFELKSDDKTYLTQVIPVKNDQADIVAGLVVSQEITEKARAQEALRASQERLSRIVETIADGITIVNQDGQLTFANPAAEQILGLSHSSQPGQLYAEPVSRITDIEGNPFPEEQLPFRQVMRSGTAVYNVEFAMEYLDGRWLILSINAAPLHDGKGSIVGVISSLRDITEQKWAEVERIQLLQREKLARNEAEAARERVINILESITDGVFTVDHKWRLTYLNRNAERLLERPKEALLGRNVWKAMPKVTTMAFYHEAQKAIAQNVAVHFVEYHSGLKKWFDCSYYPSQDGLSVYFRDITAQKQAEAALQEIEERFKSAFQFSVIGIALVAPDGSYLQVNPALCRMVGYTEAELLQLNFRDLTHPGDLPDDLTCMDQLLANQLESYQLEKRYRHKDGSLIWVQLTRSLVRDFEGQPLYFISQLQNITERKRAEAEIHQLNFQLEQRVTERTAQLEAANQELANEINQRARLEEELRQALKKERELNDLKSRFVSMTSHEFRTPLSTILANTELLKRYNQRWTEEKKLELFQRIEISTRHMTNMLEDILIIGKAESGKLEFKPASLDVLRFCQNILEEFQLGAGSGYQFELVARGSCGMRQLDEKLLRQIIGNLLSNALKYSKPGSTIYFELDCQANGTIFKVRDQGIGIPAEDLPFLFEVFHRAKNVGTIQGTGLGLTIVKRSVDLHGGTIEVESELEAGTTFTVWLPVLA
jgi:PAS domain S-box-containing protein